MADQLRDWTKGNKFEAAHLQEPVTALRKLLGVPGAGVGDLRGRSDDGRFQWFVGKVVDEGPDGEDDFDDERYWVQPQFMTGEAAQDDQIELSDQFPVPRDSMPTVAADAIVPVTNLSDLKSHGHGLAVDAYVWVFMMCDAQDPPVLHYLMSEGGGAVSLSNNSDVEVSGATQIDIPGDTIPERDNGSGNVLEFIDLAGWISGAGGLRLKTPDAATVTTPGQVPWWTGSAWTIQRPVFTE